MAAEDCGKRIKEVVNDDFQTTVLKLHCKLGNWVENKRGDKISDRVCQVTKNILDYISLRSVKISQDYIA